MNVVYMEIPEEVEEFQFVLKKTRPPKSYTQILKGIRNPANVDPADEKCTTEFISNHSEFDTIEEYRVAVEEWKDPNYERKMGYAKQNSGYEGVFPLPCV